MRLHAVTAGPATPVTQQHPVTTVVTHTNTALVATLAAIIVVLLVALLWSVRGRSARAAHGSLGGTDPTPSDAARPAAGSSVVADHDAELRDVTRQRDVLVATCIQVSDLAADGAIVAGLRRGLSQAGYTVDDPSGALFDPRVHEAVDSLPTRDPTLHDRIATTQRPGYWMGERLIRPAQVIVYQLSTPVARP